VRFTDDTAKDLLAQFQRAAPALPMLHLCRLEPVSRVSTFPSCESVEDFLRPRHFFHAGIDGVVTGPLTSWPMKCAREFHDRQPLRWHSHAVRRLDFLLFARILSPTGSLRALRYHINTLSTRTTSRRKYLVDSVLSPAASNSLHPTRALLKVESISFESGAPLTFSRMRPHRQQLRYRGEDSSVSPP